VDDVGIDLETVFVVVYKFGDTKSDGRTITVTQSDRWMKQVQILNTETAITDTGVYFNKFKLDQLNHTIKLCIKRQGSALKK
jgi:hypothetical protein